MMRELRAQVRGMVLACMFAVIGVIELPDTARADSVLVFYDVADLVRPLQHFPAPRLGLSEGGLALDEEVSGDLRDAGWTIDALAELVEGFLGTNDSQRRARVMAVGRTTLAVFARAGSHGAVTEAIDGLRAGQARTPSGPAYKVTARLVLLDDVQRAQLGLTGDPGRRVAQVATRAALDGLLSGLPAERLLAAPVIAVTAHRSASLALLDALAYVADHELRDGIVEPVVETIQEGLRLEILARPLAGGDRVRLGWLIERCAATRPLAERLVDLAGTPCTIEEPEVLVRVRQGRNTLVPGQVLVVSGGLDLPSEIPPAAPLQAPPLPAPDGQALRTILILDLATR